jgi:hypothetical protein
MIRQALSCSHSADNKKQAKILLTERPMRTYQTPNRVKEAMAQASLKTAQTASKLNSYARSHSPSAASAGSQTRIPDLNKLMHR